MARRVGSFFNRYLLFTSAVLSFHIVHCLLIKQFSWLIIFPVWLMFWMKYYLCSWSVCTSYIVTQYIVYILKAYLVSEDFLTDWKASWNCQLLSPWHSELSWPSCQYSSWHKNDTFSMDWKLHLIIKALKCGFACIFCQHVFYCLQFTWYTVSPY
jgi:hypothetical protein